MKNLSKTYSLRKLKDSKKLKEKAWKLKSQLVRLEGSKDGVNRCFTCGAIILVKEANAGHYIHKDALDFHPINIQCQCVRCNKWLSGNLGVYAHNLIEKYGLEEYKKLESLRFREHHFTIKELEEIIDDLKQKLHQL
jgi:hypothetical protein